MILAFNFSRNGSKLKTAADMGVNFSVNLVAPDEVLSSIQNRVVELSEYTQSIATAETEQSTKLPACCPPRPFQRGVVDASVWQVHQIRRLGGTPSAIPASAFGDSRMERVLVRRTNLPSGTLR